MAEWTETWPVEPGHYWCYGGQKGFDKRLSILEVKFAGPPEKLFLMYICNVGFVYPKHYDALFLLEKIPKPDLPK